MNAIYLYKVMRWCYIHKIPIIPKFIQLLIFLIYNSKLTGDTKIGKGSYFVCKGISSVLIPGTEIGENCVLGLRFSTVRQFPYRDVPIIGNNVWIGPNVIVAGPVLIGNDVIIVGNSYVTKSVPEGAIVSGNPAKIVGWRKDLAYDININPKYMEGKMPFLKERRINLDYIKIHNSDDITDKVIKIISECLEISPKLIHGNETINDIDKWDSLSNIMIISEIEEQFKIVIPKEDLFNLISIDAFVDEIRKCSKGNNHELEECIKNLDEIVDKKLKYSPLLEKIIKVAKNNPQKLAIIDEENSITYAELINNVRRMATFMENLGLKKNDKILLSGQKDIEFIYIYLASHLLGVLNVVVDSKSNKERLNYIESVTNPKFCFGYIASTTKSVLFKKINLEGIEPCKLRDLDLSSEDVCEILFTTGTTGNPKGVCLTFANIYGSATNINEYIKNDSRDVELIGLPICHSFGLGRIRCNLINGATIVLLESFANVAKMFEYIEKFNVTGFGVVPAAWAYITQMSGDKIKIFASQIKYIEIGSASMPLETKKKILQMFPNTRICMHYGSTEASRSCFMEFHDLNHINSIGKPVSNLVDVKIFDHSGSEVPCGENGEICIKGNMVLKHYLKEENNLNSFYNGYFRTGDCGYKSEDGYFYLVGREKEIINVGGKKVSPSEVEDIICSLGVGDCVCVPMHDKDGILGEVVKCYILKDSTTFSFEEISDKLKGILEPYKRPAKYEWIDEIPKTDSGKKQRLNLK